MSSSEVSRSCSLAEAIERNEDLLTEILLRVGAATLIRFKCVSKRWLSLISAPYFCHRHTVLHSNAATKVSGLFMEPDEDTTEEDDYGGYDHNNIKPISFEIGTYLSSSLFASMNIHPNNKDSFFVMQSCNGLLLCQTFNKERDPRESFIICNPTTNRFKFLPDPFKAIENPISTPPRLNMSIAFDPSTPSDGYTAICIWKIHTLSWHYNTMVYSSSSDKSWRHCGSPLEASSRTLSFCYRVYFNGSVHWICMDHLGKTGVCLRFDLREERLRDDNMPPLPDLDHDYFPAVACGHLNLVGFNNVATNTNIIRVYRMATDYSRWLLLNFVDLCFTQLPTSFPEMLSSWSTFRKFKYKYNVLHLMTDTKDYCTNMSLVLLVDNHVVVFRLKDNSFKRISDYDVKHVVCYHNLACYPLSFEYVESLVQL